MLKGKSTPFIAFIQASGLVFYIVFISYLLNFIFPTIPDNTSEFYAPIIMLLLFIISAVISSLMVLGRALFLFWEKRYKESFNLVIWTVGWGILYFLMFLLIVAIPINIG